MDALQITTLSIALLGAGLGVLNTWRSFDNDRVKLKVRPAHAIGAGQVREPRFCISVVNTGNRAVTVEDIGFRLVGSTSKASLALAGMFLSGGRLPLRLDPLTSTTIYASTYPQGVQIRDAYATTACGKTFTGSSAALRQVAKLQRFLGE